LLENGAMRSFVPRFGTPLASAAELGLRAVVGYLLLYVAVDWVSFIHPMRGLNVTPWNPQAALAVALLVWRPRLWWLVWAACMCADVVVRIEWVSWPATVCLTALQAAGYSAIAAALHRWVGRETQLRTPRDFVAFSRCCAAARCWRPCCTPWASPRFGCSSPSGCWRRCTGAGSATAWGCS
jgi:hypothetical protein